VTALCAEYVYKACAAADVDLAAFVVDEEIIGVAASFGAGNRRAVVGATRRGFRDTINTRPFDVSKAIGKLPPSRIGHLIWLPVSPLRTAGACAPGTLTKTLLITEAI
jgi:hypothetical protein